MWTLNQALDLIREIQSSVRQLDYHITLGGGVLNTGSSEKDLDLFFLPLHGTEPIPRLLETFLYELFGPLHPMRDAPDYAPGCGWQTGWQQRGEYLGKRVDLFIV